ncbi:hypothetical protein ABE132_06000 [Peribacillus simplex]|uniref:hypothetical protein n=1 Tax=Peribacillus simplex TaxID=1478 RepID=UPI003D2D1CA8
MAVEKEFVEAVQRGEKIEELKKLHPLQAMQLGLSVRQLEEEQGVSKDAVQFDNEAIGEALKKIR